MKIALTGATGFIGRYLVRHLADQGHQLRCWYRPSSDRSGFESVAESIEWVLGDLSEPETAEQLVSGTEAVVHSALWRPGTGFRGSEGDIPRFAEVNIVGTLRLIEAARQAGAQRFVFLSTCAVHERILDDRPLDETHPLWPLSHYGAHKAAIEKFVHSYGFGDGYPVCALRPTGVYGVAHPVSRSRWFPLVRDVVEGKEVVSERGGKEVHAADVAKAAAILLEAQGIEGQAYNCYDCYVSEYDVADFVRRETGSTAKLIGEPKQPLHQIETEKIRDLGMTFGGQPLLEATLRQLIDAVS